MEATLHKARPLTPRPLPLTLSERFGFDFESEERASKHSKTKYGDLSVRSGSELKLKTE